MILVYLWLVSKPPNFQKFYICDFVLKLLGTLSHAFEDTALFVNLVIDPREYGLERVNASPYPY